MSNDKRRMNSWLLDGVWYASFMRGDIFGGDICDLVGDLGGGEDVCLDVWVKDWGGGREEEGCVISGYLRGCVGIALIYPHM